ncbi:metal ABC transporter ATP-binding protein [Candidatus Giovannonibacteria bacterium]|nr:metal ABC transporter ATP-binding protein [Candidatus Giovannonibacteria bacterium]
MSEIILEVKNLQVEFGGEKVLENVSFAVREGDSLAIIGPNGSGKTTLFRALIGAVDYKGEIKFTPGVKIGFVPQIIDLERNLPITVEEFFSLKAARKDFSSEALREALLAVKLTPEHFGKGISVLSAGEFQRVLVAWAILGHPRLLLFDEPTASVDVAGQETIYELLHELQDRYNLTLMLISHDLTVVYRYANQVLCLNKEQICFGSPREVLTPRELSKLYGGHHGLYHHLHGANQHGGA